MKAHNRVRSLILPGCFLLHLTTLCFQMSGAPNDDFADATVLSGATGTLSQNNNGGSKEPGEPDHADNAGGSSMWFSWTAPTNGQFSFNTAGSAIDTLLAAYTGASVNALTRVASNDDFNFDLASAVSIQATSGTTYHLAVDGFDGETGALVLNWAPEVPPANDNFTNALVVVGPVGTVNATNSGATKEAGEPDHAGELGGRSIWFRWTATSTNEVSITTVGSNFDTTLAVYTGASVNALSLVASNDEFAEDSTSAVTFPTAAGTTYQIAVDGYYGAMGAAVLNWEPFDDGIEDAIAGSFKSLHHFTNDLGGFWPEAPVIAVGNRLFGTTLTHNPGAGTLFAINTDGTGFTVLKTFNGGAAEGGNPYAGLISSGESLYGTASVGGASFRGAVFTIKTNGTAFNLLHSFATTSGPLSTNAEGAGPQAGLVLSGDTLFGAAQTGGNFGAGTIFAVKTNGTGFLTLHHFAAISGTAETNSEGAKPVASLVLSGDNLYGVAIIGGTSGNGTVFTLKTNGSGFNTLRQFDGIDGYYPRALILSGHTLYGTTSGTLFAMTTNGAGFTNLASFAAPSRGTPYGPIVLSGDRIFGATATGGTGGKGTIYSVRTNGTGFVMLHQFPPTSGPSSTNSDGAFPRGLSLAGNALYGTAQNGGDWSYGTVFSLTFPRPTLTITPSGTNIVLTWPAAPGGFNLQTSTDLASPMVWITNSSSPVAFNGQNTVTHPATGAQKFFRLKLP
jgi:hypothetical protein